MIVKRGVFLFYYLSLAFILLGCGGSKTVPSDSKPNMNVNAKTLLASHYNAIASFSTLQGKMGISILDDSREMGYTLSLRMNKNEKLWLNATLGIVRALVSVEGVQFYNKLDQTYFEGRFDLLSKWLGVDLNFNQLQNLLLGQSIMDIPPKELELSFSESQYQLRTKDSLGLDYRIRINPNHLLADQQYLSQNGGEREVIVNYLSYQNVGGKMVPEIIVLTVTEGSEVTQVELNLHSISFNQQLNFPFNIPEGYQKMAL